MHLREAFIPLERRWMVLFPEGGFLRKRLEVSQKYAAKNNLPILKNVTLPRIGALKAIMEVLPTHSTMGNNNATAKRTPDNGTLRPFGSQGTEFIKSSFDFDLIAYTNLSGLFCDRFFSFSEQSTFFNIKTKRMMTPSVQCWTTCLISRLRIPTKAIHSIYQQSSLAHGQHAKHIFSIDFIIRQR